LQLEASSPCHEADGGGCGSCKVAAIWHANDIVFHAAFDFSGAALAPPSTFPVRVSFSSRVASFAHTAKWLLVWLHEADPKRTIAPSKCLVSLERLVFTHMRRLFFFGVQIKENEPLIDAMADFSLSGEVTKPPLKMGQCLVAHLAWDRSGLVQCSCP